MSTAHQFWHLTMHTEPVRVVRLAPGSAVPPWAGPAEPLSSITWNAKETTVVAPVHRVPLDSAQSAPFLAFEVENPSDFLMTGVLNGLLSPMAQENITAVAVSTFETDWILIPLDVAERAVTVWRYNGHTVDVPASWTGWSGEN